MSAPAQEVLTMKELGGTLPDVIWGPGSSAEQICRSLQRLAQRQRIALAARVDSDMAVAVQKLLPDAEYNARAHVMTFRSEHLLLGGRLPPKAPRLPGTVALVMGKAADAAVAEECRAVGEHLGCYVYRVSDASAAGLQGAATTADVVVVVVAGCDTALPSMVAGLVDAPVIAVPTSEDPQSARPCAAAIASGVTVVAMDDGLGAAVMATRMLRMASRLHSARMAALAGSVASSSA